MNDQDFKDKVLSSLSTIDEKLKHVMSKEDCKNVQHKIKEKIQSNRIWSIARDIVLLFSINVIAVISGIKIMFPNIKLF